jgi:hypothetical protein
VAKTGSNVKIYQNIEYYTPEYKVEQGPLLFDFKRTNKVFIGKSLPGPFVDDAGPDCDGNTILVKPTSENEYIYIGDGIKEFKTNEPVVHYQSPIGNNDVPYPFAITESYIYLMLESYDKKTKKSEIF